MQTDPDKLVKKHHKLIQSTTKSISHTQREKGDWFINSLMIEGCDVPFKYKRPQKYKTFSKGQRVNLTYYSDKEVIAGLEFEYMKVVRIKIS